MPCEADVSGCTRQRRAWDVAYGELERARVASSPNYRGDAEPRNFHAANRGPSCRWRSVSRYPRLRRDLVVRRCRRLSTLQDGVELLIFERLIETRFGICVQRVAETQHPDNYQQTLEPAASVPPRAVALLKRAVKMLDEAQASPTPCRHCAPSPRDRSVQVPGRALSRDACGCARARTTTVRSRCCSRGGCCQRSPRSP